MPTLTLSTTTPQAQRIATAYTALYGLREGETAMQLVERKLWEYIRDDVRRYEKGEGERLADEAIEDLGDPGAEE